MSDTPNDWTPELEELARRPKGDRATWEEAAARNFLDMLSPVWQPQLLQ